MKRLFFLLIVLGILLTFNSCGGKKKEVNSESNTGGSLAGVEEEKMEKEKAGEARYVEGEVLVKFKPEVSNEDILRIIKEEYKCEILDLIEGLEVYRLKIPKEKTVPEMVEVLSSDERVKYAEPNFIYRLQQ